MYLCFWRGVFLPLSPHFTSPPCTILRQMIIGHDRLECFKDHWGISIKGLCWLVLGSALPRYLSLPDVAKHSYSSLVLPFFVLLYAFCRFRGAQPLILIPPFCHNGPRLELSSFNFDSTSTSCCNIGSTNRGNTLLGISPGLQYDKSQPVLR